MSKQQSTTPIAPTWTLERGSGYGEWPFTVGEILDNPGRRIGSSRYRARLSTDWVRSVSYGPLATQAIRRWEAIRDEVTRESQAVAERLGIPWQLTEWWQIRSEVRGQNDPRFARLEELEASERVALAEIKAAADQDAASFDAFADDDGPARLIVVAARQRWIAEDGDSLGVGSFSGYLYTATVQGIDE